MSLAVTDVQQVLAVAILDAKLASTQESAAGFAATLAPALTQGLNLIHDEEVEAGPQIDGNPYMTLQEALKLRDAVAGVISSAEYVSADRSNFDAQAEALLKVGFIDVPQLLLAITSEPTPSERDTPATGQHEISTSTGMVATVGTPD